jgi:diaminohydroxyphosphoribosylaminopyrimidine deaminase / 5-amino-6-(5-phosphoribosylamino)uracil reductase
MGTGNRLTMPTQTEHDSALMRECFRLAQRGKGYVSPNPMVGAVLARGGRILARGYHQVCGGAHAEVECLSRYRGSFDNTTLYINLEPCSHYGKTPPCADLLAATPIPRVVIAMTDPNPLVRGKGIDRLRAAGKAVEVGLFQQEARELNRHFMFGITRQRPYVHVKIAQSLDGMIAGSDRKRRSISGPKAVQLVHQWRAEYDAVLVGAGTVRADDPRLTARVKNGRNPAAIIVDGSLSVSPEAKVFRNLQNRPVFVACSRSALRRRGRVAARLEKQGVLLLPFGGRSRIALPDLLGILYALDIGSVLVEGGSEVFGEFMVSGLVDELTVFIAPMVIGDGVPAYAPGKMPVKRSGFTNLRTGMLGNDIMLKWIRPLE